MNHLRKIYLRAAIWGVIMYFISCSSHRVLLSIDAHCETELHSACSSFYLLSEAGDTIFIDNKGYSKDLKSIGIDSNFNIEKIKYIFFEDQLITIIESFGGEGEGSVSVICFNAESGNKKWVVDRKFALCESFFVENDLVYVFAINRIAAISIKSGNIVWDNIGISAYEFSRLEIINNSDRNKTFEFKGIKRSGNNSWEAIRLSISKKTGNLVNLSN